MLSRLTPVVRAILILNAGLFLIQVMTGDDLMGRGMGRSPLTHYLSLYHVDSPLFLPFQFLSYAFLHGGLFHILFNMYAVVIFGVALESFLGEKRFLTLYLTCAIGAAALYMGIHYWEVQQLTGAMDAVLQNPTELSIVALRDQIGPTFFQRNPEIASLFEAFISQPDNVYYQESVKQVFDGFRAGMINTPMLGASGAVFGILMAVAMIFPNQVIYLLFIPFPIKMKWFVLIYGAIELINGVKRSPGDNVAHFAHIGGMVFAFILVYVWRKQGSNWRRG